MLLDLRWRAVPFLIPLALVAALPAVLIWCAALIQSLGLGHPLDSLPVPSAAPTAAPIQRTCPWPIVLA